MTGGHRTIHDGPSLPSGEIIAPIVGGQRQRSADLPQQLPNAGSILESGGLRGRQLQVLVEGTYSSNRLFATVQMIPKTVVEVGTVGRGHFVHGWGRRGPVRQRFTATAKLVTRGNRGRVERAAPAGVNMPSILMPVRW
jgi:hypothetical protein